MTYNYACLREHPDSYYIYVYLQWDMARRVCALQSFCYLGFHSVCENTVQRLQPVNFAVCRHDDIFEEITISSEFDKEVSEKMSHPSLITNL